MFAFAVPVISFVTKNKWAQWLLIVLLAIGLFFAFKMHYISIGKDKGKVEEQQVSQENIQDKHAAEQEMYAKKEAAIDAKLVTVLKIKAEADDTLSTAKMLVRNAEGLQKQALEKAKAVPIAQVHDFNRSFLNQGRTPNPASCYTPDEERMIQESLVGYSGCKDEISKRIGESVASEKLIKQAEEITRLNAQLAEERKNRLDVVEGDYVLLFNSMRHPEKAWKCAKLWKCGNKKIEVKTIDEARAFMQRSKK